MADENNVQINEELLIKVLDAIRPSLQADGGDLEYLGIEDGGIVKVRLQGACSGCPMAALTLNQGVERVVKEHVPGVVRVVSA